MVSTNGHDQQRSICLRLRDVLYPRDAVALSSLNREVRGSTQALLGRTLGGGVCCFDGARSCRRSRCGIRTTLGCCTPLVRKLPNHSLK